MNMVLLGPQGSGKGTQGEKLSEKYGMYYLDVGSYLRKLSQTDPTIDQYVNKTGALLPDELLFEIIKKHLAERNQYDNIVFDGYPRSRFQWDNITSLLSEHQTKIDKVIILEIDEEETVSRLSARRIDPETGKIYNLITNPPGPELDQSRLIQRKDDTPEVIKTRLTAYRTSTEPLLAYLKENASVIEINGSQPIDSIFNQIVAQIEA